MINAARKLSFLTSRDGAEDLLDAELVGLGLKLSHAIMTERRAIAAIPDEIDLDEELRAIEAAWAPTQAIYVKIAALAACSVPGHCVKALAASWYAGN